MTKAAGTVSPFSANKPAAAAAAQAMAAKVIDKLAALPEAAILRATVDEPSAPETPPTAIHDIVALPSTSSASTSHPSHTSLSSRSSSIALPYVADDGCSVFFARVPPTKQEDEIMDVFQQYGPVHSINLYRRWAASKSSKGCGIVTYADPASADAAITALHNQYFWPDAAATMVVEKVDLAKLRKDTADRKTHSSSRLQMVASCGLDAQPSISSNGSAKELHTPAAADDADHSPVEQQPQYPLGYPDQQHNQQTVPPGQARSGKQQQQADGTASSVVQQPPPQRSKAYVARGHEQEQQLAVNNMAAGPAWVSHGYPGPHPSYYGLNSSPMQYMMYPPGYCYPVPYPPHMAPQCMWMPYMGPASYGALPGYHPYVPAAVAVPAATAVAAAGVSPAGVAASAATGSLVSSNHSSTTGERRQYQHVQGTGGTNAVSSTSSSSARPGGFRKQHQQLTYSDAPYPHFVDSGDQVLNAKQLTTCMKNCATADAVHYLVQQHIADMNHIHVSAALGRLAVISASSQQNRTHAQQQQRLVISLMDHLIRRQLDSAKPFELCNSLSAAGKLGYKAPADQVQLMLRVFVDRLGLAKPNEVCTMLSAAARMGQRVSQDEFQLMMGAVVNDIKDCAAKKAQELLRTVDHVAYVLTEEHRHALQTAADEDSCQLAVAHSISNLTIHSNAS